MKVNVVGEFLNYKQGVSKDNEPYHIVYLLSGEDVARVKFPNEKKSLEIFAQMTACTRMEKIEIPCTLSAFNSNVFFTADVSDFE